jgi:tetratricopeptide (TPR) repeat protein
VVAIDAAENLLDDADHRMLDMDLEDVFDILYRRRGQHRIQVVLSTREEPRAAPGHSWMLSAKRVRLDDGISPTDFGHLLRRLDHHGDVVPPETPEAVITEACRITGGHPRLAELLIAYASREYRTLDRTVKMLSAVPAARVPELLYDRMLRSLDPLPRQALEAVAAFGAPVDEKQVGAVLPGRYEPRMLENVLRWLVRRRLLETAAGLFYLRAPDTQRVLAAKGPQSRLLLLRAATVLGRGEKPDPDRAEDFAARIARIDVLLTANEFDEAYNLMDGISRRLYERNRGDLLFRQRLRVRGQLADRFDELLNYNALGDVYLRKGRYEDARNAYERSIHLAADADPVVRKRALVNLASAVFNLRDTAKAFSNYQLALGLAGDRRSEQIEPRKGLADCYRRWGRIDSAIAELEAARRGLPPGLSWGRLSLTIARLHIEADRLDEAEAEVANVAAEVERTEHRRLRASCRDAHAYLLAVADRPAEAIAAARQAVHQANRDGDPVVLGYARTTLAYTYLLGNRPGRAADAIDPVARDRPEGSQLQVLALRALSRLRRDRFASAADFAQLRDEASRNIARDEWDFASHDFLGFAASGLHICRGEPLGSAVQAVQRSQADRPAGLTRRLLALLNMLDDEGRLAPVCDVLTGKPSHSADQARPPNQPSA